MQNAKPNFLINLYLTLVLGLVSTVSFAQESRFLEADSLFDQRSYQEAMSLYEDSFEEGVYSPAMLLKMAFIAEGISQNDKAILYLGKYYDINPDPQIITKIKALTNQASLEGYEVSDQERFILFLSENDEIIIFVLSGLLLISLILILYNEYKSEKTPIYWPTILLICLLFGANNFLNRSNSGLITQGPTLILSEPSAAGELIQRVEPGHRLKIKAAQDIWYEVDWKGQRAFVKKSSVAKL